MYTRLCRVPVEPGGEPRAWVTRGSSVFCVFARHPPHWCNQGRGRRRPVCRMTQVVRLILDGCRPLWQCHFSTLTFRCTALPLSDIFRAKRALLTLWRNSPQTLGPALEQRHANTQRTCGAHRLPHTQVLLTRFALLKGKRFSSLYSLKQGTDFS